MAMKRTMCATVKTTKKMLETTVDDSEVVTPRQCASYKHLEFSQIEMEEFKLQGGPQALTLSTSGLVLVDSNNGSPLTVGTTTDNSTIRQNIVDWNDAGLSATITDDPPGLW